MAAGNLIVVENISKNYGVKSLLSDVSFGINEGDKVGLIGVNGTGKSTLLKILAGVEEADEGTITMRTGLRLSYLPQTPEFDNECSILENVIRDKKSDQEYRNLSGEAAAMLEKLGIEDVSVSPSILSGGQRRRASLVRTLLTDADVLILDEPTNHLDAEMTEWLEERLKKFKGAFICITHDRYFLDEVTNKIFEIDKGKLYSYQANYSQFVLLKAEREAMEQAAERKAKSLFRSELAWMLRGARARTTKQKAHISRFEALRDRDIPVIEENVEFFSAYSRLGKKTIEAEHICKAYGDKVLIDDFSYIFLQNDRIGIIGPNGCGKSTLIKILTSAIAPDSGTVNTGETVKYACFAQECEFMNPEQKVIDYIKDTAEYINSREGVITASRMCEKFLFTGNQQYSPIGKLSGGEKRRLYLLKILMTAPNVLILDEPTNDLDIMTLTILEDYLQSFEGIIIAVSHDRYFLDKLVKRIFVFRGNGVISQVEGNYTDYREKELSNLEEAATYGENGKNPKEGKDRVEFDTGENSGGKASWKAPKKLKFTYSEQREYDSIDSEIETLESELAELETKINESGTDYFKLNTFLEEKKEKETLLEEKMDRWVYLNDLAEKIKNQ